MLKSTVINNKLVPGFVKESVAELKQVIWPDRQKVVKLTGIVIGVSLFTGLVIGGFDLIFTALMAQILK